jgi:PhnB protein
MDIPEHYMRAVIPHIIVKDAAAAIQFYASAFGASELFRLDSDDGTIAHAEISVQGSTLMLSDPHPPYSPPGPGGAPVILHVYVAHVDDLTTQAVAAGAELLKPAADMPYGARQSTLRDPFGHVWIFLTPIANGPTAAGLGESTR